jgi:predicted ribosomally synthesized peptide with SipW-like signal peptide
MRKILFSLMVIGITATMLGAGTMSYFSDSEMAVGNTFSAGTIDLKIDVHSTHKQTWPCGGTFDVELPIIFGEKDLVEGDHIFYWHDIKPGDFGEATISIHVYDNDAWFWMRFTNIVETGGILTEPEEEEFGGVDLGELAENTMVRLWKDEGVTDGFGNDGVEFGCDDVGLRCGDCPPPECWGGEGDNIWQEEYEPVIFQGTLAELFDENNPLFTEIHIVACTTYYIGWAWKVPFAVGNEIQGDDVVFDIEFYAQQYRNNPDPVNPWA